METLYERIDRLCKERGYTVGAMCRTTGVASSTMAMLHKGKRQTITIETAGKIASFLNVSTDTILGIESTSQPELTQEEAEWLERFRALSPEQRDAFWKLVGRNDA